MKSQSELNFVFILVAGAIILAFLVGFAFKYKDLQEEKTSIQLVRILDDSLTALKSSPYKTYDQISIPVEVKISCDDIKINDRSYRTSNLIFSGSTLKNKMLVYYRPFKLPFKISDFYLITDPNKKFNLVHDASTRTYVIDLISELPEELQSKFSYSSLEKNDVNTKNVKIFNLNDDKVLVNNNELYPNQDLVYAAIFSDNFECVYRKVMVEIDYAVDIYKNKALTLRREGCDYNQFLTYLDKIGEYDFSFARSIESLNNDLASQSCPVLY